MDTTLCCCWRQGLTIMIDREKMTRIFATALSVVLIVCTALFVQAWEYDLPDTGQDKCYNDNNELASCPQQGEPFYGQDSQYHGPQPLFKDNGDGTVKDLNTGMMWQQGDGQNSSGRTWQEACNYCEHLVFPEQNGYSDWRLPTRRELISLLNFGLSEPAIDKNFFPDCRTFPSYWSNEASNYWAANQAWVVSFSNGLVSSGYKDRDSLVRCVRGTPLPEPAFYDHSDGSVTDLTTGLMWHKNDSWGQTWKEALDHCECLDGKAGALYSDWRLPSVRELESIVFPENQPPCGPVLDCPVDQEWTSSTFAARPAYAWQVNFMDGSLQGQSKDRRPYFRCVRDADKNCLRIYKGSIYPELWNSLAKSNGCGSIRLRTKSIKIGSLGDLQAKFLRFFARITIQEKDTSGFSRSWTVER